MQTPDLLPRKSSEDLLGSDVHNRIFDATIEILVESGFAQACGSQIAQRAGVSVGSIYRFYPNKHAIYTAIAERYLADFINLLSEVLGPNALERPWAEVVDEYIDRFAKFYQKNAVLVQAWDVLVGNPETRAADDQIAKQSIDMWRDFLANAAPGLSHSDYRRISMTLFWLIIGAFEKSIAHASGRNLGLVEETKIMANAYLDTALKPMLTAVPSPS